MAKIYLKLLLEVSYLKLFGKIFGLSATGLTVEGTKRNYISILEFGEIREAKSHQAGKALLSDVYLSKLSV
jgi:hypothetical protein